MNPGLGNCPNCGVCLCTGALLNRAKDGTVCCTVCVNKVNAEIQTYLNANPKISISMLKKMRLKK